jgi:PX domain
MNKTSKEVLLKISINNYSRDAVTGEGDKKVTFYLISISYQLANWKVKRRFNEFYQLHERLSINFRDLPDVPQKTFFAVDSEKKIEKRKKDLEDYLTKLLGLDNMILNTYFVGFIKLNEFAPDLARLKPLVMANFETAKALIFTDISHSLNREVNYVLCSKGINPPNAAPSAKTMEGVLSPTNSAGSNSNPSGYQNMADKSILSGFLCDKSDPLNIFQTVTVTKTFDLKAHCVQYFTEMAMVAVGFSKGIVACYKEERKPKSIDEYELIGIAKIKVGSDRVTRVAMNIKHSVLYVIARTNKVKVIDMRDWSLKEHFKIGNGPICNFMVDESCDISISTSDDGKLYIADLSNSNQVNVREFKVIPKGRLSCMDWDFDSGKVITACAETGDLYIIDISFPFSIVVLG